MGLLLDLAVAALAILVSGSLGLLAWTLGVSAVAAANRSRRRIATRRAGMTAIEARMTAEAAALRTQVAHLAARTQRRQEGE